MYASIRSRLRIGLLLLIAALAILATVSVSSLRRVSSALDTLLRENYPSILACDEMNEALETQDSAAFFRASGREHAGFGSIETNRKAFQQALVHAEGSIVLAGEAELVVKVRKLHDDYCAAVDRALGEPANERVAAYFRDVAPRFDRVKDAILELRKMNEAILDGADADARALARRSVNTGLALGIASSILAIWTAWWLGRAVVRPVDQFVKTATAIGELDLDLQVPEPGVRELAPLAVSFRSMVDRLRAYRDRSQDELRAARDLAKTTVECMLDPVIVFDESGQIRLANDAAATAFAIRSTEVPDAIAAARDRVLADGEPVLPRSLGEAMLRSGPDGERYYLVRAAPLRTTPGESRSVLVLAQDVTRYRRIDELKSDVVATVSHEFKTPLTSLRMATHMLLDETAGSLTEAQREIVTTAHSDTERLRRLVDELLDVVRIEQEAGALRLDSVDVAALLHGVAATPPGVAREKNVNLEVAEVKVPTLTADRERLTIVLANLVANAIRHTPAGGRITLDAHAEDDTVRLTVADTGEGIVAADLPRIFERSGRSRHGHGLGLAIAREIVNEHGGEIEVRSAEGKGSAFSVVLPISRSA